MGKRLNVRFADEHSAFHELTYVGDELEALRRAAAARRNGQPVRRILILEAASDAAAHLLDLLVAEFAVQSLPTRYARAVALSSEPPDLVLAQMSSATVNALRTLRAGCAADVPLWARQMEVFILEDMNELEAARIMLGGLLASGAVQDPAEARFLAARLKALEARLARERR